MTYTHVVDVPILNYLVAKGLNESRYVAPKLFVPKQIEQDDAVYVSWDDAERASKIEQLEVDGYSNAVAVKFEYNTHQVRSKTIAVRAFISHKDLRNASDPIVQGHEQGVLMNLMKLLWTKREKDASDLAKDSTKYPSANVKTMLTAEQWDDVDVDPFLDMATFAEVVSAGSDQDVNFAMFGGKLFSTVAKNPNTKDYLGTLKEKVLNVVNLSTLLSDGVVTNIAQSGILTGRATYNSATGDTPSKSYFWDKTFIMGYNNPDAKNMMHQQTFAQMFIPKGTKSVNIYKYVEPGKRGGYWIEAELTYSLNIIDSSCAFLGLNMYP